MFYKKNKLRYNIAKSKKMVEAGPFQPLPQYGFIKKIVEVVVQQLLQYSRQSLY